MNYMTINNLIAVHGFFPSKSLSILLFDEHSNIYTLIPKRLTGFYSVPVVQATRHCIISHDTRVTQWPLSLFLYAITDQPISSILLCT